MAGCCVATTLFKVNTLSAAKADAPFDVVVLDEASQIWLGPLLAPAALARSLVLVGDPRQLPPLLHQEREAAMPAVAGLDLARSTLELLLERHADDEGWFLRQTYRMNRHVCAVPNALFYGNLEPHPIAAVRVWPEPSERDAGVEPAASLLRAAPGIAFLAAPDPAAAPRSLRSRAEAQAIANLLLACERVHGEWLARQDGLTPARAPAPPFEPRYLVSCFYRAQVAEVRSVLLDASVPAHLWQVDTVERNQGRSCSVGFLSVGAQRVEDRHGATWFHAPERWNVAMTRARFKVYVLAAAVELLPEWLRGPLHA